MTAAAAAAAAMAAAAFVAGNGGSGGGGSAQGICQAALGALLASSSPGRESPGGQGPDSELLDKSRYFNEAGSWSPGGMVPVMALSSLRRAGGLLLLCPAAAWQVTVQLPP